jgi:hypothetical protein
MEEETSTTISAVALVDYLEKTAGRAKAMREAKAKEPEAGAGDIAAGANAIPGPEDPTDQLSHSALAEIHLDLKKRRVREQAKSQPLIDSPEDDDDVDTVTFDEGIPALSNTEIEVSALELDSKEIDIIGDIVDGYGGGGFDDPDEDTTLKGGVVPVNNIPPPKNLGDVTHGASWKGVDPNALGASAEEPPPDDVISASPSNPWPAPSSSAPPPSEPPTVPDGDISMTEMLPETRDSAKPEGDSEPPTEVWDQPPPFALPEPGDGFGAGDRAALMAGIAVAIILLVGLAGYLLL